MTDFPESSDQVQSLAQNFSLEGKVALVTGAGRGIGRACALALADAGARVIAVARTAADLDELCQAGPAGAISPWVVDATSPELLERIEGLSALDVLVNNAGTNRPQAFVEVTDDALETMVELNLLAAFRVARAAARVMRRAANGGSIIHMSSQMGHVGSPGRTVYCMTKHGIEGLNRAMAVELAPDAIRVNSVAPTFIETPMTRPMLEDPEFRKFVDDRIPLGHMGQPRDVAMAVLFLASSTSAMVTGDSLRIDGGWTAQ